ncbi:MAG: type II secretion system F family protein, partial [Minisyncoccales bacterium]
MVIGNVQKVGMGFGLLIIIGSLFLIGTKYFLLTIGLGVIIGVAPFIFVLIEQARTEAEKEEMFLEFTRNLVESVKTGTPISKSILNAKNKPYGVLSPHIKKLANQISLGISLNYAVRVFANDVNNKTVSRTIGLIGQAERAGGNIERILEAVAEAVTTTDKLKKERKSSISNLVFQGYIIFFIFIAIVLLMQFKIIPL